MLRKFWRWLVGPPEAITIRHEFEMPKEWVDLETRRLAITALFNIDSGPGVDERPVTALDWKCNLASDLYHRCDVEDVFELEEFKERRNDQPEPK